MRTSLSIVTLALIAFLAACSPSPEAVADEIRQTAADAGYTGALILDDPDEALRAMAALRDEAILQRGSIEGGSCEQLTLAGVRLSTATSDHRDASLLERVGEMAVSAGDACQLAGAEYVPYDEAHDLVLEAEEYIEWRG